MLDRLGFSTIQNGLVLFWSIWLSIIALTNITDLLKQTGALPAGWTWASYNYGLVVETVGRHGVPALAGAFLFAGVIAWQLVAAALFWRAYGSMRRGAPGTSNEVAQAFAVSLALWAVFLIATEATVSYETAATHKGTLIAQIVTLLVVRARPTAE